MINKTKFFMLGIVAAFGALFLELLIFTFLNLNIGSPNSYSNSLNFTIIFSIFLEELVKIIFLFRVLKKMPAENIPRKYIYLSAVIAGLGFATMEILFTLFNTEINRYLSLADVLGLLTVHATTFAILGYALAKWNPLNFKKFMLFLPIVFAFHLFYNTIIIYQLNFKFYFLFIVLSALIILIFWKDLKKYLPKENLLKSEIGV